MAMDLTGIVNSNEYYTNHYFATVFEDNAADTISSWRAAAKDSEGARTPWSLLRDFGRLYTTVRERYLRTRSDTQVMPMIKDLADSLLETLGYDNGISPTQVEVVDSIVPVYMEVQKANGSPLLWVLLCHANEKDSNLLQGYSFDSAAFDDDPPHIPQITETNNEELISKIFFSLNEPPRWLLLIGINSVVLIDRNKWNEKRYLLFDLDEIFSRREESTLQAVAVLLHNESLCPNDGA